jgi:hypothetical protein
MFENLDDVILPLIVVNIYSNDQETATDDIFYQSNGQNSDESIAFYNLKKSVYSHLESVIKILTHIYQSFERA